MASLILPNAAAASSAAFNMPLMASRAPSMSTLAISNKRDTELVAFSTQPRMMSIKLFISKVSAANGRVRFKHIHGATSIGPTSFTIFTNGVRKSGAAATRPSMEEVTERNGAMDASTFPIPLSSAFVGVFIAEK